MSYYDPHARAKAAPDPYGRQIGESYRDACTRMLGQLRAQDVDLSRLRAGEQQVRALLDDVEEKDANPHPAMLTVIDEIREILDRP